MLLTLLTVVGTVGLTTAGHRVYYRIKHKLKNNSRAWAERASDWNQRPVFEGAAWKEFIRCIDEDCKGYLLVNALIESVFDLGFRFTCVQIYEITSTYKSRFKIEDENIKELLKYKLTLVGEAQEKVQKLIMETDERLLLR